LEAARQALGRKEPAFPPLLAPSKRLSDLFLKLTKKFMPHSLPILQPFTADQPIPREKIIALDCRYTAVIQALDDLVDAIGLKARLRKARTISRKFSFGTL
jgi:hypothetical protein